MAISLKEHYDRLIVRIQDIEGDIVECGVGAGATLKWMCLSLEEKKQNHRMVWGFDSFEGFPKPSEHQIGGKVVEEGYFLDKWHSDPDEAKKFLCESGYKAENITMVKGFFENSLHQYKGKQIALLHLDCDLYISYQVCLNTLYDKIPSGGILALDEYRDKYWPGATKAIKEFFVQRKLDINGIKKHKCRDRSRYFYIKP